MSRGLKLTPWFGLDLELDPHLVVAETGPVMEAEGKWPWAKWPEASVSTALACTLPPPTSRVP